MLELKSFLQKYFDEFMALVKSSWQRILAFANLIKEGGIKVERKQLPDGSFYEILPLKRVVLSNEGIDYLVDVCKGTDKYTAYITLASANPQPIITMSGSTEEEAILNAFNAFKEFQNKGESK